MAEQQCKGDGHTCADQNIFQSVTNHLLTRRLTELIKQGTLVGRRVGFASLPFADRDGMDTGKLSELDLVQAELLPQFLYIGRVQCVCLYISFNLVSNSFIRWREDNQQRSGWRRGGE